MPTPPSPSFVVRLRDGVVSTSGQPEATLGYRLERGAGQLDGGNWAGWRWDGRRLTVENDRMGAYPLYYAADREGIALSPSIDELLGLGVSRELDLDGLAAFLVVGYYLGQDTPFAAIRAMPPAAVLTWQSGDLAVDSRPPRFQTTDMTRAQAIDGIIERARTAVARCLPDDDQPYPMPVSGGRDSRHILLELMRAGRPPSAGLTVSQYPTDWGGDAPYAEALCRTLGIAHRTLDPGPLVAAEWRKNRLSSYGADEHAWYLPVVDALRGTARTFDGLGGGTLLHREFMTRDVRQAWRTGSWDELADRLGKKDERGESRFATLIAPSMRSALNADVAAARIRRELARHLGADDPYLSFTVFNRTRREVSLVPNGLLAGVTTACTPFTDPDYFAFAASIPGELVATRLHTDIIATAFPEVAGVPYVPKRRPAPSRSFLRRVARDLAGLVRASSDGSLVDRRHVVRRATISSLAGDAWPAWGRRAVLATYLVQLETVIRGDAPGQPEGGASRS